RAGPPFCLVGAAWVPLRLFGKFIRMKSTSKKRTPSIVNLTVKRRYLTQREIDRLMDCARKHGRYGHGLPPWPAGVGGLRPAMAADRAIRRPPARSPGEEWNPQRPPNPR